MVIGWIAGGLGCAGMLVAAWAWRGRAGTSLTCRKCRYDRSGDNAQQCPECGTDRAPVPRRRRRWVTLGIGMFTTTIGAVGVAVPTVRHTPLLNVMPTDVLIAGASVIPRSWLYEPIPRAQLFFGKVEGHALNQRDLSETQKRQLTRRIDAMLARQDSLTAFGALADARPMCNENGMPLSNPARLRLLDLLSAKLESDPAYEPDGDFKGFLGLSGMAATGFGTLASEGFREPDETEAETVDRFVASVAALPIDDFEMGSVSRVAIWMHLLGPWFPAALPTLLEWVAEQSGDRSNSVIRSNAAVYVITQTGAWNDSIRSVAIELMRSENEHTAGIACVLPIIDDELARVYEPTLREVVTFDDRDTVTAFALNSLVLMGVFDRELYATAKERAAAAGEYQHLFYRASMRYPAEFVSPDVDFYMTLIAEADVELQSRLVGNLWNLYRTFEKADPDTAARIVESAAQYLESDDEHVRRSAFWVDEVR